MDHCNRILGVFQGCYEGWFGESIPYNRPAVRLADGTILSIQASESHYCRPRMDSAAYYSKVEVASSEQLDIRREEPMGGSGLLEYLYPYVSVKEINTISDESGGIEHVYLPMRRSTHTALPLPTP